MSTSRRSWRLRIERSSPLPTGPWDYEPDRAEWRDEDTGLPCLARRGPLGQWCGYVAVPPGHPWHGADYDALPVDVHGGLTFAAPCDESAGICHAPRPGEPGDVWWLGFDCAHLGDLVPGMVRLNLPPFPGSSEVYRPLAYVRRECAELARQVAAA